MTPNPEKVSYFTQKKIQSPYTLSKTLLVRKSPFHPCACPVHPLPSSLRAHSLYPSHAVVWVSSELKRPILTVCPFHWLVLLLGTQVPNSAAWPGPFPSSGLCSRVTFSMRLTPGPPHLKFKNSSACTCDRFLLFCSVFKHLCLLASQEPKTTPGTHSRYSINICWMNAINERMDTLGISRVVKITFYLSQQYTEK